MSTTRIGRNSGVAVAINKDADDKAQSQPDCNPSKLAAKLKRGISLAKHTMLSRCPVREFK
jgi:hypothetical protein